MQPRRPGVGGKPNNRFADKKRGEGRGPAGPGGPRFFQKKVCRFCSERAEQIDYKDLEKMRRFLTEKGKVMPRRITGNCAKHQRVMARAIKRARHAAIVAFQID